MAELRVAIKAHLMTLPNLEEVDPHRVADALQPAFPELSLHELTMEVVRVAAEQGFRYLVWNSPAPD